MSGTLPRRRFAEVAAFVRSKDYAFVKSPPSFPAGVFITVDSSKVWPHKDSKKFSGKADLGAWMVRCLCACAVLTETVHWVADDHTG